MLPRRTHAGRHLCRLMWLLAVLLVTGLTQPLSAQTNFPSSGSNLFPGTLFGNQPNVFAEDGRIKVLVLGLNPFGLTESASEQIGLILQKNLNNTGHFAVVGPRELAAAFEQSEPDLVDCREIACGVEAGKRLNADQVLVSTIHLEEQVFVLNARLINTFNNNTAYEEELRFTDENMDEQLFSLVNNMSRNSIRIGKVLSTSVRGMVISLGARHGLRIGDHLVVYKQDDPASPLPEDVAPEQRKNIGIVKTINVNENTSDAIVIYKLEEPQADHYVKTYLEPTRQIELVENTRRELDTNIRLASKVLPLQLAPVLLADTERRRWDQELAYAEAQKTRWFYTAAIAGGITVYLLYQGDTSNDFQQIMLYSAIGVTGYSVYRGFQYRGEVNDLKVKGRSRGYVDLDWNILPQPGGASLLLTAKF
jgi:hypothetical protein